MAETALGYREDGAYEIEEHRHRFSVWAAARAAQRGWVGATVDVLRDALQGCGIVQFLASADLDSICSQQFERLHRQWCVSVISFLENEGLPAVTFGRAAKLVAVYLKSAVVLGPGSKTQLARVAHPPIDKILLRNLSASPNVSALRQWANTRWTKLTEVDYYILIMQLRGCLDPGEPFWKLERFWTVTND